VPAPHEVLGVDPDADEATVRAAYRRRVKAVHPDQGGSTEQFQAVQDAYEQLLDESVPTPAAEPSETRGTDTRSTTAVRDSDRPAETITVEYLDYAVLEDFGWSLDTANLFQRARRAGLDSDSHGRLAVEPGETLLEAAEHSGFAWPFACRGGACTNCAVAVVDGQMPPPVGHILPESLIERGIRLSCLAAPVTDDAKVVYNVKRLPAVAELLLPASRFEQAHSE